MYKINIYNADYDTVANFYFDSFAEAEMHWIFLKQKNKKELKKYLKKKKILGMTFWKNEEAIMNSRFVLKE